jgi:hypothetical protein
MGALAAPIPPMFLTHGPDGVALVALQSVFLKVLSYFFQIPPDLVVKFQPIDIVDVIL